MLKTRFPILKVAPQYAFHIQRDIVIAACVLHNYIRGEEGDDWLFLSVEGMKVEEEADGVEQVQPEMVLVSSSIQDQIAFSIRDSMASAMWDDFINKWDDW